MKRLAKIPFIFLSFLFLISSCGERVVQMRLSEIGDFIDLYPDSALIAIRQIDTSILRTRANRAKYALLHAMALDKNYIDTADTRIIMPAVDYYEFHGSSVEKLKALMYLGTAQYNAGLYNQAIVSLGHADELSNGISDYNLKGILYSKIAEVFSKSQEYVQANDYLDKAIECFEISQRPDQRTLAQIMKVNNLLQLMDWEASEELLKNILSDNSITDNQRGSAEGLYAMVISYNPNMSDTLAFRHFQSAIALNGSLDNANQYCAYAYLLSLLGKKEESDLLFGRVDISNYQNRYAYAYWKHRQSLHEGDYKQAYYSLWSSRQIVDSLAIVNHSLSAANAQRIQMESLAFQRMLKIQNLRGMILFILLITALLITIAYGLYSRKRRKTTEEHSRMEIVIDHLRGEINKVKIENADLVKEKTKARFKVLASLYEEVYHQLVIDESLSKEKAYEIINARTRVLGNNDEAQTEFEKSLDEESDNIMSSFRKDYPGLKPEEYRLASLIFAGFDNTAIMIVMGITSLEYTRVKKNRLKNRIQKQPVPLMNTYLGFFK